MGMTLEVCVDTAEGIAEAVRGGADRIELCSALEVGGLTPAAGLMAEAAGARVPVMVMIRPRSGDFIWSEGEVAMMEVEIAAVRQAGLQGVVLGASLPDGRLDGRTLERLVAAARGLDLTLHRAFDLVPDMGEALEKAIALGFRRILTSGGAVSVTAGAGRIADLVAQAAGRIAIMPGAGVRPDLAGMLRELGVDEVHASCSEPVVASARARDLGFAPPNLRRTSALAVRALKVALG